ncbi:hypothetical protein [Phytohabitans houttuyneae]|uniref:OmpR/PhoB-type domain-containing protein n=1 Tax=Phytohabitans houttuyneae TaxID=1076126 RepID=A0A6V8JXL8_9ACTN|nr:hypothetical protein [Phytohabitans houttuyneae]GFJ76040.1 hypothetical protein Phou_002200 [Phytohabitans houttuyneae]
MATVRVYVMHLRRLLDDGSGAALETRHHGYRLVVGDADLDARVSDRLYRLREQLMLALCGCGRRGRGAGGVPPGSRPARRGARPGARPGLQGLHLAILAGH